MNVLCHCQSTDAYPNKLFLEVLNSVFCIKSLFSPSKLGKSTAEEFTLGCVAFFYYYLIFFGGVGLLSNSATYLQKKKKGTNIHMQKK